jgi:hypothetical protein
MTDPLDEITKFTPDQRLAVCRLIEDRFINAIQPLSIRLQRESPVNLGCDATLQEAQRAVDHVMEHVNEVRRVAGVREDQRFQVHGSRFTVPPQPLNPEP